MSPLNYPFTSNYQWEFQDPEMEVPTIYKAYLLRLCKGTYPQNMATISHGFHDTAQETPRSTPRSHFGSVLEPARHDGGLWPREVR